MALVRPIAQSLNAFDATQNQTFYFTSNGGDQVVKNKIVIRKQSDNTIVYQNTVETYQFQQVVPSNTLSNGEYYNYYFVTYNITDEESPISNIVSFRCYTTPTVAFTNVVDGGTIESATYTFDFTYEQEEGELLDFLIVRLYDINGRLIKSSGEIYYDGYNDFSYEISGLEDNTFYGIDVMGNTINGTTFKSDLINFNVLYVNPILYSKLRLTNRCDEGYIQVQSNVLLVDGETMPPIPKYVDDNTKLSIINYTDYVQWLQGYEVTKDFILEIWGTPSRINEFCRLWNKNEDLIKLNLIREIPYDETEVKDYFTVTSIIDDEIKVYTKSNYVPIMNNTTNYVVWVKKIGNDWELIIDILDQEDNILEWNGEDNNVVYDMITDLHWKGESYTQGEEFISKYEDIDDIFPITASKLRNGIYDHMNITQNTNKEFTTEKPQWDYDTLFDCDFDGNVSGGNITILLSQISGIKIKRRTKGEFDWITLRENTITTIGDINMILQDSFVPSGITQEYAIVPILNGDIEGDYIISEVTPKWNGLFLSTKDKIFKLYGGTAYGGFVRNKQISTIQPINSKYPYVIQNGATDFISGSVNGSLYGYDFEETRIINKHSVIVQTNDLLEILGSGDAMCITDWNGDIWLGRVYDNDNLNKDLANGYATISFNFVEQGKYNNQSDLFNNGLIDVWK